MSQQRTLQTFDPHVAPPGSGAPELDSEAARLRVLELSARISELAAGRGGRIEDLHLAQEVAQTVKPYVDRLVALRRLVTPVDGIIEKRDQIHALQEGLAADVAAVEHLADDMPQEVAPTLLTELEGEIAAVKRDRKLVVDEIDDDELETRDGDATAGQPGAQQLLDLPVPQRLERILGARFVTLGRLEQVFDFQFEPGQREALERTLEPLWRTVFETEELRPHVQRSRVKALQRTFADYALLLRCPDLGEGTPCTPAALRQRFAPLFLHVDDAALWYTRLGFWQDPLPAPQWALVDRQYLNCTFKKPSIRLLMYARANDLPARQVRQKSLLEDLYDRAVLRAALERPFFETCNSITSTTYQPSRSAPIKQVYVFEKDGTIRISGKRGTPHWRPTRPRWPGVLPAVVFTAEPRAA